MYLNWTPIPILFQIERDVSSVSRIMTLWWIYSHGLQKANNNQALFLNIDFAYLDFVIFPSHSFLLLIFRYFFITVVTSVTVIWKYAFILSYFHLYNICILCVSISSINFRFPLSSSCVLNVLMTSCADNVCRIWAETVKQRPSHLNLSSSQSQPIKPHSHTDLLTALDVSSKGVSPRESSTSLADMDITLDQKIHGSFHR